MSGFIPQKRKNSNSLHSFHNQNKTSRLNTTHSHAHQQHREEKDKHEEQYHSQYESHNARCPHLPSFLTKKKMTIKPFKVKPVPPPSFEEKTFKQLEEAVDSIHKCQSIQYSREELYRSVENLCRHHKSSELYDALQLQCDRHIASSVDVLCSQTSDPIVFLELLNETWANHCIQMTHIRCIFLYLDRSYVIKNRKIRSIWDMAIMIFRQHFLRLSEVNSKTISYILNFIEADRNDHFERPHFLSHTEKYYREEGTRLSAMLSVSDYLAKVTQRLKDENDIVSLYLDESTRKPLLTLVEKQLIKNHASSLISKGFFDFVDNAKVDDLGRLYILLARVKELPLLKGAFEEYVIKRGHDIVMNENNDKKMVDSLLILKRRIDNILKDSFDSDTILFDTCKRAFENFINERKNKPAEMIAKYIDHKLRIGSKGSTEEELEHIFDESMILFRYIQGKDVFEAFYKKDLAKRLLLGKSASIDMEMYMISKLKLECGPNFTKKLENMFKDMKLSEELIHSFDNHQKELKKSNQAFATETHDIELNVRVLTQSHWPDFSFSEITIPGSAQACQEEFRAFYKLQHDSRRLVWQHSLGQCTLRANFTAGVKLLLVSVYQASILALFNGNKQLTYEQLKTASGLQEKELKLTLKSLAFPKMPSPVLLKIPKTSKFLETDIYSVNMNFRHNLYKVKINALHMKETIEHRTQITEQIVQDRYVQIDSVIVRIMKHRKEISHQELMSEVHSQLQLRFDCETGDIKNRIGKLIEREYIDRHPEDSRKYIYLA